jgi:two-component sensor histidine kinase
MGSESSNILIVEDEPAHAEAIRRALEHARPGIRVRIARSLAEFHDLTAAEIPDLAIMDLNLPDGRAVEVLTAPPESGPFPILLMTSYGDERIAVEAMKAGALDYLVKSQEAFTFMPHSVDRALREWALIQERMCVAAAIQTSLREKEVLLREIHHRVKNNMQVISSLFGLQIRHTENDECRQILKESQNRVRSMGLVHEKLYHSSDLSKIDLASYIQSLAVHLFHAFLVDPGQVALETDLEDVSLDINSAVPCGLIMNELISNALRHGFPNGRKGAIRIELKRGPDGTVILRVADDGIGFSKDVDFRKAEGFGLQIVNMLVGQLEATFELDRAGGTAFTVMFRELKYASRI